MDEGTARLSSFDENTPAWLDTEALLPGALRRRIASALTGARELQRTVTEFCDLHCSVFRDYAAASADESTPEDVWEVLDRSSGYASLWINVLAAQATLASMLDVPPPALISPR
jgi:hypothetical protein